VAISEGATEEFGERRLELELHFGAFWEAVDDLEVEALSTRRSVDEEPRLGHQQAGRERGSENGEIAPRSVVVSTDEIEEITPARR
jgi:hypothetical protein